MNYQIFKTWEEAESFAYPKENKSNYYAFLPKSDEKLPIPIHGKKGETHDR